MVASNLKMAADSAEDHRFRRSDGPVFEKNLTQFIRDNPGSDRASQI